MTEENANKEEVRWQIKLERMNKKGEDTSAIVKMLREKFQKNPEYAGPMTRGGGGKGTQGMFIGGGFAGEMVRELDDPEQAMPKVTRDLPHIRQPEDRHRDDAGAFKVFVDRQYLPQFFRYI